MNTGYTETRGLRMLVAALAAKLIWDAILLSQTFTYSKLAVVTVLPVLIFGLLRGENWALILTGVVSIFWITFFVARLLMPIITVGSEELPAFPWSNLIALPGIVFVVNHLKTDEEMRKERHEQQETRRSGEGD
jgi:hypothetical protein